MSVVTTTVSSAGRAIDPSFALLSVDIRRELNRLPTALLLFADGDIADRSYPISDSGIFDIGKEIEIKARYEGGSAAEAVLFKGLVVRHGIETGAQGSVLRVEMRDKAVKLTRPRRSQVTVKKSDADLIEQLISAAGLTANVEATRGTHETAVQYDCSDWDFLLTRAEANGLVVSVKDGAVTAAKPEAIGASALVVDYGISEVFEIEFETDALGQDASFKTQSWDVQNQASLLTAGKPGPAATLGSLTAGKAAQALGFTDVVLMNPVVLPPEEAKAWADSEAQRGQLSLVRGRVSVAGFGKAALLTSVELKGLPKAFCGKALVSGLCHRINGSDGWVTDLQFGLSPQAHRARSDIGGPAAGGLWPAVGGLQIGVVADAAEDPEGENRVQVKLPGIGDGAQSCWARVAMPDAGNARGWYFWPEPGDEVVLGFFNQDPRRPVILGSLFGSKNKPPADIVDNSDKNLLRGLVTKKGLTLAFVDDDKAKLWLQTPGGAKVLLDDDAEAVVLTDPSGNTITLDKNGITIKTDKDFKVDAGGSVEIMGGKVDIK